MANLLRWQARFSRYLGRGLVAEELAQRSLNLLDSAALANEDLRSMRATALLELGAITADYMEAWNHLESSLALYRSAGVHWGTAQACYVLGESLANMPGYDARAQTLLAESLQLFQSLGDRRSTIQLADEVKELKLVSYQQWRLGEIYLAKRRYAEARKLLDNSVEVHRNIRYLARLRDVLTSKGLCAYAQGEICDLPVPGRSAPTLRG